MRAKITFILFTLLLSGAYAFRLPLAPANATPFATTSSPTFNISAFCFNNNPPHIIDHFSATSDGKKVTLLWKSCPEKKSDYFTIERSKDGVNFTTCLIVKGSGHDNYIVDYAEMDFNPLPGLSYYRIKQTDYEGHKVYSTVVPVNFHYGKDGNMLAEIVVPPEEAELIKIENKLVLVVLRDSKGIEHTAKVLVSKQKDQKLYALDTDKVLPRGLYTVVASSSNALYSQSITIL